MLNIVRYMSTPCRVPVLNNQEFMKDLFKESIKNTKTYDYNIS